MDEQFVEKRIRDAVEHAVPDVLDRVLAACDQPPAPVVPMPSPRRKRRWAPLAAAAVLALVCTGALGWRASTAVASVVSLDVNPSIQLQVNSREKVLDADPLNEDARRILDGMDLRGTQLKVAVNAIVGSLLQNGYLDSLSSAILISVEDTDAQRASRLEGDLTTQVDAALQNAAAGAAVLSQVVTYDAGLETQAQASGISVGKAALLRDIAALNSTLSAEALQSLSVEELTQLRAIGAPGLPIGKSAAAAAAETYAGLTAVDAVTWEVEAELDESPACYEVALQTHFGEFEYQVDAWTGQVLLGPADVLAPAAPDPSTADTPSSPSVQPPERQLLSRKDACAAALAHAGVSEGDAQDLSCELDEEDGRALYEIEFETSRGDYEYLLDAYTGAVLEADIDLEDD